MVLLILLAGIAIEADFLPLPIGQLSDYGSVLDRYGRERISSLIEGAQDRFGIEVYILASWENPYRDIDHYAVALLDTWNLGAGKTLLAVFLKEGRDWEVNVLTGAKTSAAYPQLARRVEEGINNLVEHRRVEEAMVELFSVLERQISPESPAPRFVREARGGRSLSVLLLVGSLALLALFIQRRVCPRCGRILRVRASRVFGPYGGENVIYYCRKCGYSRTKKGEG